MIKTNALGMLAVLGITVAACSGAEEIDPSEDVAESADAVLLAPTQAAADSAVNSAYSAWKSTYVTSSGAGGFLRVQRTENSNDTVSEGIAYGMILAAYMADKTTFDGLWSYAKSHLDSQGLMHWQINASNVAVQFNGATDADEDMALALVVADKTWGGYGAEATSLINRIMTYEVEPGTFVLKPGDQWGGSSVTNPGYFAPAFYKVFKATTGDARWDNVVSSCYAILANLDAKGAAGTTGLVPDWLQASGDPASGQGYNYSYDAVRAPYRLAVDAAWFSDARAITRLGKLNTFWQSVGAANIKDGYTIGGALTGQWHNAAFVGPAAAGAVVSSNTSYKTAMWNELVSLSSGNYYNDSLRALTLLFSGNRMPSPLGTTTPPTNQPPTVSLTAPANNASYAAPATITLQASAADSDGTVSKVEFFSGATKLGEASQAPYSFTWSSVAAGTYSITARATDNAAGATTSSAVAVVVNGGTPPTDPPATGSLALLYKCANATAVDSQIKPQFSVVNNGTTSVPLSELKIRYYYTIDGVKAQTAWCDWAQVGCANVVSSFTALSPARPRADTYLEVSFGAGAGSLAPGAQTGDVQIRFAKNDWTNYTQTGDYSFDPAKTSFTSWSSATLYRQGTLVWGAEP